MQPAAFLTSLEAPDLQTSSMAKVGDVGSTAKVQAKVRIMAAISLVVFFMNLLCDVIIDDYGVVVGVSDDTGNPGSNDFGEGADNETD